LISGRIKINRRHLVIGAALLLLISLFQDMTVLGNVMTGHYTKTKSGFIGSGLRLPGMRRQEKDILLDATHFLNLVEQGGRPNNWLR